MKLHAAKTYKVIIVTNALTDMSGVDLCRELMLKDPEPSILFLVGADEQKLLREVLELGVSQYLVKDAQSAYLELLPGIVANLARRAEASQVSDKRYRQIADISSDWVWEMDAKLRFSYFSEGFQRLTGIDPKYTLGKTRREISSSEDLENPHWENHLADLEARREFKDFHYIFVGPEGEQRCFQISGVPIFDNNKKFQGYRGIASEVTARVSEQRALAESNERLRHAVALAKLGHYVWDGVTKRAISCTEEYARIHGVTVDEYLASTDSFEGLFNWIHPEDRDFYLDSIERAIAGRKDLELEYRIVTRDGRIRYVHEIFDPTYDKQGRLIQTAGAMQDITERKETEEALKDAERLSAIGNWRWSVEKNQIISFSEGYARVLGLSVDEVPARMAEDGFGVVYKEDREHLDRVFNEAMEKGQYHDVEYRILRPDGEVRDIQQIGEPIHDTDGRCRELKGTIQDITERKNIERELNEAKTLAEMANRAKSGFLSSMSHELRTPLNAILGFAQVLGANKKEPLTTKQKSSVEHIVKGGRHLLKLINQVLDFAGIETGQTHLSIEPVDIDRVILDCLSITEALPESKNIQLIDNVSGKGMPPVLADLTRFKQVLLNLLANSAKYNRENGSITVDAEVTPDQMIRICVTDTGFGISEHLHDQVFEAFERLGRETLVVEGTGIGLTISKHLVELMHGRIGFSSETDKGSAFWIELPLARPSDYAEVKRPRPVEIFAPKHPKNRDNRDYRILYIEDNSTNTQLMLRIFEGLPDMELITAVDAESGLEIANAQCPDLVLMDIQLPGMDGIEAFRKLKQSDETRDIPVIAISAAVMANDMARAESIGFYDYLAKPIDIGRTLEVVRNALGETR